MPRDAWEQRAAELDDEPAAAAAAAGDAAAAEPAGAQTKRLWKRAKGGVAVMRMFDGVNQDVKMYGTTHQPSARQLEAPKGPEKPWFVILPSSTFHAVWDLVIVLLLMYVALVLPVRLAFDAFPEVRWDDPEFVVEFCMDMLFIVDMGVNFLSAFWRGDTLVTEPREIAKHYLRTWFAVDLVASLPLYLVDIHGTRLTRLARLPRLLRLLKMLRLFQLLRLLRLGRYVDRMQFTMQINMGFVRIFNFVFWFVLMVHFVSCTWVLLGNAQDDPEDSWKGRAGVAQEGNWDVYLVSTYWALSTLVTVGYGDVVAVTTGEYLFSIVTMMIGVSFYSFIISNISNILSTVYAGQSEHEERSSAVRSFAIEAELPDGLRKRIMAHFRYMRQRQHYLTQQQRDEVLGGLSTNLHNEVVLWLHRDAVECVPLFRDGNAGFVVAMLNASRPLRVGAGEFIQHEAVYSADMFFLVSGRAEVLPRHGEARQLVAGSYFGELAHFVHGHTNPNVRAVTECHLLSVPLARLRAILTDYEAEAARLKKDAVHRCRHQDGAGSGYTPAAAPAAAEAAEAAAAVAAAPPAVSSERLQRVEDALDRALERLERRQLQQARDPEQLGMAS